MNRRKIKTFVREPIAELEDLRDDTIAIVLNSGMSFQGIKARGGPSPATISKWLYKETRFPQLATVRAILRACDFDLAVTSTNNREKLRINKTGISMPPRKKKEKIPARKMRKHR